MGSGAAQVQQLSGPPEVAIAALHSLHTGSRAALHPCNNVWVKAVLAPSPHPTSEWKLRLDANQLEEKAHLRWMHGSKWCCQRMSVGTYECRACGRRGSRSELGCNADCFSSRAGEGGLEGWLGTTAAPTARVGRQEAGVCGRTSIARDVLSSMPSSSTMISMSAKQC